MRKFLASFLTLLLVLSLVAPTTLANQTSVQSTAQAQSTVELEVSQSLLSLTEVRTVDVKVDFGKQVSLDDLQWKFGDKSFEEWKKWNADAKAFSGESFIKVIKEPHFTSGTVIEATLEFGLPFDTDNLAPRSIRVLYPDLMGDYELTLSATEALTASTTVTLNVYDEFLKYDEIKPAIDKVFTDAEAKNDRYLEYKSLGKSVQGRDIPFVVLAKDKAAVDKYLNETLPTALDNPAKLLEKLEKGTIGDYQVPIWLNNIHPDEVEGVDFQVELLKKFAIEDVVTFKTTDENGTESTVTLNVNDALDHVIFLFNFVSNPDGRVANTRANANGFDLNRDNAYQTQSEIIAINEELAKWTPLSFLDGHGYVNGFLIEPATPPHNPNFEYDLLIDSMMDQAHAMGRAGVANSNLDSYFIPLTDWGNGWDDMTPAYSAIFAMLHGSLGHTIEVPTLSQDSLRALVHSGLGATKYVIENKDLLFKNQLTLFKRGVDGEDNRAVDQYYVNQAGEQIGRIRGDMENFFPEYYVIPVDENQKNVLEAKNMVKYLIRNGIKVEETLQAVNIDGKIYPKGTYVVPMKQAKRGLANAMLYKGDNVSDWDAMYDPIVVNFSALRGFDIAEVRVEDAFTRKTIPIKNVNHVILVENNLDTSVPKQVLKNSNNDVVKIVNNLLAKGKKVEYIIEDNYGFSKGDFVVMTKDLQPYRFKYVLDSIPATKTPKTVKLEQPKVAVIGSSQSTFSVKELGFKIVNIEEADVIIDDSGAFKAEELEGKTYVGIGGRALAAVKKAELLSGFDYKTTKLSHEGLLKANVTDHLVTSGYESEELLYTASGSWITSVPSGAQVLAKISNEDDFYVAGWWPGHESAKGQTLAFTTSVNDTTFSLFANDLVFRGHTQHSYRLLANSIFAAATKQPHKIK
ncbi:X-prolyl-dipeptidyl aminopeptidase [Bacillus luteolus]|uniref:X-prolyl-dipeptidyl aminopeptidase n=1 Tax=Litchfieldia luteola TaxID=682179 RepID=A0ABR9QF94_9BACI|nr:M14 family zinc carboxypeptidase [Cytobacillus luteolus]MBE4907162.1 X-prolyl-dipeptidyl aminopeptidase [Cytobacillus luteolus]MBP1943368.1 murein tripeptide amidase MpaA [Cytobacillus luteolus]